MRRSPSRWLPWIAAAAFLGWEGIAAWLWVRESGGVGAGFRHLWAALRSDWMALIIVSDHLVIAGVAMIWTLADAARRKWTPLRRFIWAIAFIALGSPALLVYIAQRESPPPAR